MKKYLAVILPLSLITGILFIVYLRFVCTNLRHTLIYFDIMIIAVYILWLFAEFKISKNDTKINDKTSDYGTRELYATSQALVIISAIWFYPVKQHIGINHLTGTFFFIAGIALRLWAIRSLGEHYSHTVRRIDNHKIIDTGPYSIIRHPAYAGMIIAHIGILIIFFNYITLSLMFILFIPSVIIRIQIEEKMLIQIEGYKKYVISHKRLIPFIW